MRTTLGGRGGVGSAAGANAGDRAARAAKNTRCIESARHGEAWAGPSLHRTAGAGARKNGRATRRSGADDLVDPLNEPVQLIRRDAAELVPETLNRQCTDLADLHPG